MPSQSADRQRRLRERRADGRIVLRLELDEVELVEMLTGGGLLDPRCADDRQAVEDALARQIQNLCRLANA